MRGEQVAEARAGGVPNSVIFLDAECSPAGVKGAHSSWRRTDVPRSRALRHVVGEHVGDAAKLVESRRPTA